jgi:hypothetical protein
MADKNIQMTQRNASNTGWDNLYPITKASNVQVTPISGLSGTDVQTVLQNLFQFANDGKTAVANAITAKGVSASPSETFASLAAKIGQISTGKKWANGTTINNTSMISFATNTTGSSSINSYYIEVTGLNFQPSLILVWTAYGNYVTAYKKQMNLNNQNNANAIEMTGTYSVYVIYEVQSHGLQVTNGSFRVPVATGNTSWNWIAME